MSEFETKKTSKTASTTDGLRRLILEGELRAGDRLTESRLTARLGVTRAPLRLALERLKQLGMLESMPGGGFCVRSFSLQDVSDAIYLRGRLEGAAARLAAERKGGRDTLRALNACVRRLDRVVGEVGHRHVRSRDRYGELNDAFHIELFVLADSDVLREAYEALIALPFARPSAFLAYQAERPTLSIPVGLAHTQHQKILRAIDAGDGKIAEWLAQNHADLARHDLRAVIRRGAAIGALPGSGLITSPGAV
jgi:GntR family transcriptional regulator of vanillate catabolism